MTTVISGNPINAYQLLKTQGYHYEVRCQNSEHVTPGPLSDYYDGRDWAFRSLAAAKRACERANREAGQHRDELTFVVIDWQDN